METIIILGSIGAFFNFVLQLTWFIVDHKRNKNKHIKPPRIYTIKSN